MSRRYGRRALAVLGGGLALAVLLPSAVTPSNASWQDLEFDNGALSATNCSANAGFDTSGWGRVLSGSLGATSLDPVVALRGLATTNSASSIVSVPSGATPVTNLTNNAWSSALDLSTLSTLDLGAGLTLPLGANTGVYTQYGRATASGQSTGASGALTSAGGGLVSLATPSSAPPTAGRVALSSILDGVIAAQLGSGLADRLSNLSLDIGAVGATAQLDACAAVWDHAASLGNYVDRGYLLAGLGLTLKSSILTSIHTALLNSLSATESSLDALLAPGTSITGAALTTLTGVLNPLLTLNVLGLPLSSGGVSSIKVGVNFDLQPVKDLLSGTLSSGAVTIDLSTGAISADLAGANGVVALDSLPPNSPLLTAATVTTIVQDVTAAVNGLLSGPITTALATAIQNATVTVDIAASLAAPIVGTVIDLPIVLTGTLGAFLGTPGYGTVTATVTPTALPALNPILGVLNPTTVLNAVTAALVGPLVTTLVPALASTVLAPLAATAQTLVTASLTNLSTTVLPPLLAQLAPVFDLLRTLLSLTANAQPDKPNPVGIPDASAPGSYFVSALRIGAVNPSTSTSLLALYLASASVGPNTVRP